MNAFELFAGAFHEPEKYPALSAFMEQEPVVSEDEDGIICKVSGIRVRKDGVDVQTIANFSEKMPLIMTNLQLIDKTRNVTIQSFSSFDKDCYLSETVNGYSETALALAKNNNLRCLATFTWLDTRGQRHQKEYIYDSLGFADGDPTILETNCTAPIAKDKKLTIVSYLRDSIVPNYDYSYPQALVSPGVVNVFMPFSGNCTVNDMFNIVNVEAAEDFLQLTFTTGGPCTYRNPKGISQFVIDNNKKKLSWNFDDNWTITQDLNAFGASTVVGLVCNFTLVLEYKEIPGQLLRANITVTSVSPEHTGDQGSTAYIERIKLQWGCMAKDSLIKMADGSEKAICEILIGDKVTTDLGEKEVRNIISGQEASLICLAAGGGYRVRLTDTHPVVTKRGNIRAIDLTAADEIKTIAGYERIVELYPDNYNDKVYNLEFDTPAVFVAGGIYTGDYTLQNLAAAAPRRINKPDKVLRIQKEAAELFQRINGRD
jgi:hypothetical protein